MKDRNFAFFESIKRTHNESFLDRITCIREFGNTTVNKSELKWVRDPSNLKIFYGTVRKIGLEKFISANDFHNPFFTNDFATSNWKNKSLSTILNDFIDSYGDAGFKDRYYVKFWQRRKEEQNEETVWEIFKDIQAFYQLKPSSLILPINDTLHDILFYEVQFANKLDSPNVEAIISHASILIQHDLHASAYNFIQVQLDHFQNAQLDSLLQTIVVDSVPCSEHWKWREGALWFNEIYDYHH
ncbi:MAG: hypothetical protein P1U56_26885 [Saprospiraceae bacterium]|nr:hypothetical protein [Saprospiraceae bacterium]